MSESKFFQKFPPVHRYHSFAFGNNIISVKQRQVIEIMEKRIGMLSPVIDQIGQFQIIVVVPDINPFAMAGMAFLSIGEPLPESIDPVSAVPADEVVLIVFHITGSQRIMPAATVWLVPSSIRTRLPVILFLK